MFPKFVKRFYYRNWILFHPIRFWEWLEIRKLGLRRGRVLDAGCGNGAITRRIAEKGAEVYAVDRSPAGIEAARKYNPHERIHYQLGNLEKLDFPDGYFDKTFCVSVLGQCDKKKVFRELVRVTKKGGIIYLSALTSVLDGLEIPENLGIERKYAIRSGVMKTVFGFFLRYRDWRFLSSSVFYPFYFLDMFLVKEKGLTEVIVIKR